MSQHTWSREAVVAASGTKVQDTSRATEFTKLVSCLMTLVLALGCNDAVCVDFVFSILGLDGVRLVKNGSTGLSLPLFVGSTMGGGGRGGRWAARGCPKANSLEVNREEL